MSVGRTRERPYLGACYTVWYPAWVTEDNRRRRALNPGRRLAHAHRQRRLPGPRRRLLHQTRPRTCNATHHPPGQRPGPDRPLRPHPRRRAGGYGFIFGSVGAQAAEADAGAGLVAVVAPLLAVVAGLAGWTLVDRDVTSSDPFRDNGFGGGGPGGVAAGPRGLAAPVGAVALAADPGEPGPADRTEQLLLAGCSWRGCRRAVVVPRGFSHGGPPLAVFGCGRGGRVGGRSPR